MANSNGWGDGASNNQIGWGQGADNAIGWGDSHLKSWAGATDIAGFDSAAISYFNATGISGATQQDAIDNLVRGLKDDGIWPKMKALYPFVTDNRNLLGYTEDFSNAAWSKGPNVTITGNTVVDPNGTLTADSINVTSTSAKYIFQGITYSGSHTFSIYAKYQSLQFIQLLISTDTTKFVNFDILNGLVTRQDNSVGVIENVGNGWFRCSMSLNATSQTQVLLGIIGSGNDTRVQSNSLIGTSYIWGAQLETGSLSTYQPITTTQQAYIANQFKYNLVNPVDSDAAFRLVFNGGWTHSAQGATPNGTNGYADTKFKTNSYNSANNFGLSTYTRTNTTGGAEIGVFNPDQRYIGSNLLNLAYFGIGTGFLSSANLDAKGFWQVYRTSSSVVKAFKNSSVYVSGTTGAGTLSTREVFIGALNDNGLGNFYTSKQISFASIGDGLTDTEAANLYTRVQAFQTALNRQV